MDNRKHAIGGLWRRDGKCLARITVEDNAGCKAVKWVPLGAETTAQAQEEFRTLLVERGEDRAASKAPQAPEPSEPFRTLPKDAEEGLREQKGGSETDGERTRELERENLDLKTANRGKDFLIEQMQKERSGFFDQRLTATRKAGELESRLLQLEKPQSSLDEGAH